MKKLYVGNFPYETTEEDLTQLFSQHGTVDSVTIIRDKFDNRSKGFGFVEMSSEEEAEAAIDALNGSEFSGRSIRVDKAQEKRSGGGGGGGGNRGGGGKKW